MLNPFFRITIMQIQYITLVKMHRITLNYCLTETWPFGCRLYIVRSTTTILYADFHSQFPFVQFACKDCSMTLVLNMQNELWRFWLYINKVKQLTVTINPRRTNISTGIVKMNLGSVEYKRFDPIILLSNAILTPIKWALKWWKFC